MKTLTILSVISLFTIISCGTPYDSSKKETGIVGKWTLVKEIKGKKEVNYDGIPTASKFEFKANGYYVYYDQITNEKIAKSGVGTIQDNEKGQYILEGSHIKLNHYIGDSLVTKSLKIEQQNASKLILLDEHSKKISHYNR